jgi:hypothetical protein
MPLRSTSVAGIETNRSSIQTCTTGQHWSATWVADRQPTRSLIGRASRPQASQNFDLVLASLPQVSPPLRDLGASTVTLPRSERCIRRGPHLCAATSEAAPLFAVFERWEPQIPTPWSLPLSNSSCYVRLCGLFVHESATSQGGPLFAFFANGRIPDCEPLGILTWFLLGAAATLPLFSASLSCQRAHAFHAPVSRMRTT